MENDDLKQILARYLDGKASPEEVKFLLLKFRGKKNEAALRSSIRQLFENDADVPEQVSEAWEPGLQAVYLAIKEQIDAERKREKGFEVSTRHNAWQKYSIAAAVALLIASSIFIFFGHKKGAPQQPETVQRQDLPPGSNKAILTLANGIKVRLDSVKIGTLSMQGNTRIVKLKKGLLTYNKAKDKQAKVLFNTITTPRGGQYKVELSDGTKVWLNAASSIYFPTTFKGKTRTVRITGEAYFEVAENAKAPFEVLVNDVTIQVLGTHFNVMAYKEEPVSKVTLLQGAVKVKEGNKNLLLRPGEQAYVGTGGRLTKVKNVDLRGTIAWKNNQFWFNNDNIQTVMRRLSRWYNVEVVIKGNIPQHFGGIISRNINVSEVFEALQATSHLQYKIVDSTIIVSP